MKIKDRIEFKNKAPVLSFQAGDKVIDAVRVMSEKNYGASVIVDHDNKPIGIVTERDFMRRLLAKELNPHVTVLSDIMTSDLKLAAIDDKVLDWLRIMSNERFRHLPVVNAQGQLVNLMSQGDFVSYTWPQLIERATQVITKSFMERFHLHLIVSSIIVYTLVIAVILRSL